jgi:hypothetical protein
MAEIENEKLKAIIERCAIELVQLVGDHEADILDIMQNLGDGEKLSLTHAITVDIESNKLTNKVSSTKKVGGTSECAIPDPNQPELPGVAKFKEMVANGDVDAVEIDFGTGKSMKIDGEGVHTS